MKRQRGKDPRIVDPATHPHRYVSVVVAADYLDVSRKTLSAWLDEGKIPYAEHGERRRILLSDLVAFDIAARRAS